MLAASSMPSLHFLGFRFMAVSALRSWAPGALNAFPVTTPESQQLQEASQIWEVCTDDEEGRKYALDGCSALGRPWFSNMRS